MFVHLVFFNTWVVYKHKWGTFEIQKFGIVGISVRRLRCPDNHKYDTSRGDSKWTKSTRNHIPEASDIDGHSRTDHYIVRWQREVIIFVQKSIQNGRNVLFMFLYPQFPPSNCHWNVITSEHNCPYIIRIRLISVGRPPTFPYLAAIQTQSFTRTRYSLCPSSVPIESYEFPWQNWVPLTLQYWRINVPIDVSRVCSSLNDNEGSAQTWNDSADYRETCRCL